MQHESHEIQGSMYDSIKDCSFSKIMEDLSSHTVITFLDCLVIKLHDNMPDKEEVHLPLTQKKDVYEIYVREFAVIYPSNNKGFLFLFPISMG